MAEVILSEKIRQRLRELTQILYEKNYFGLESNAEKYVESLRAFASSIPQQTRRLCKDSYYGKWYCTYKINRHTTWYFTFDTDEELYIVRNVLNNHTLEYPTYIQ